MKVPAAARFLLLLPAFMGLVTGILAGLARLGIVVPTFAGYQAGLHGAFMIGAFFGTVISLERAVAVNRPWAYLAPLLAASAGIAMLAGSDPAIGVWLLVGAGLALTVFSLNVCIKHHEVHHRIMALGAASWLLGSLVWLFTGAITLAVDWWMSFLVLTIAGERLELTRYLPVPALARRLFVALVALLMAGMTLSFWYEAAGLRLFSAALLLLAIWLLRYDIARRTVRQSGLTRYIAVCLLSGYVWLVVGAALGLAGALEPGHAWRDAALHAIFLGFVMSMIFGHAPIILPALSQVALPYHPVLYAPLVILHLTLAGRLLGAGLGQFFLQQQSALANAIAVLLFFIVVLTRIFSRRKT